jgi:FtsH-binding integral membrane protein
MTTYQSGLNDHIQKIYFMLFVELLCSATGIYIGQFVQINIWMLTLAQIGFIIMMGISKDIPTRIFMTISATFLSGLSLSKLILETYLDDPMIVFTSLFITSMMFISLSAMSHISGNSILGFENYLLSGLIAIIITHILFLFGIISFELSYLIIIYGGLILMCFFVMYDTQKMIDNYNKGNSDFIMESYTFYLDFINIAIRIMAILRDNKNSGKKSKKTEL